MKKREFNGSTRTIVLALTKSAADPLPGTRQAKLRVAARKRGFLGLLIGVLIGIVLMALLLKGD